MVDPGTGLVIITPVLLYKILGPTADYVGEGLQTWTEQSVNNLKRVFSHAERKIGPEQLERPGAVPPRVLKGVLEEGAFCDTELGAEYLGGVLASSRTETTRDDRGASLVALISRLSTFQLRSHYVMYAQAQRDLAGSEDLNLGVLGERRRHARFFVPWEVWLRSMEFSERELKDLPGIIEHVTSGLIRETLIDPEWANGSPEMLRKVASRVYPDPGGMVYTVSPLGMELFTAAHGTHGSPKTEFVSSEGEFEFEIAIDLGEGFSNVQDLPAYSVADE